MSVRNHLKETPGDIDVKRTAWRGCKRRLLVWASQYAANHKVGGETDYQLAILADAKQEKFPMTTVRKVGSLMRRIDAADDEARSKLEVALQGALRSYAEGLGLSKGFE